VRPVIDLICERIDAIEMHYANPRARERQENYEELKFLTVLPVWMEYYKTTCRTPTQERAINTWCDLCIPLPLSDTDCGIFRASLLSSEIQNPGGSTEGPLPFKFISYFLYSDSTAQCISTIRFFSPPSLSYSTAPHQQNQVYVLRWTEKQTNVAQILFRICFTRGVTEWIPRRLHN
jgi:hypothetical protein